VGTQTIDCGIVALAGKINLNNLGDIRRQIERARKNYKNVVIDMSEVTLVDHQAVDFLAAQLSADIQLVNCPVYIQPWLLKAGI
jgi:anti-anti-sigma regulatory factor